MKAYDVVVIGAVDAGLGIAFQAVSLNYTVTLIDKGTVGGTCINKDSVPSKTLITLIVPCIPMRRWERR
jgi:pyruvate/2-oxoglutarate dehydrogenase complex dihydrolipoamide dehydrogenase (E3) component